MDMGQDGFFSFNGWFFESIDIVPQERGIHADGTGELSNVDLFVGQEELLHRRRLGVFINEALETDVFVDITPMDAVETEGILLPLLGTGSPKPRIPKERLAVDTPVFAATEYLVVTEPYFFDLDHILFPFTG